MSYASLSASPAEPHVGTFVTKKRRAELERATRPPFSFPLCPSRQWDCGCSLPACSSPHLPFQRRALRVHGTSAPIALLVFSSPAAPQAVFILLLFWLTISRGNCSQQFLVCWPFLILPPSYLNYTGRRENIMHNIYATFVSGKGSQYKEFAEDWMIWGSGEAS